MVWDAFLKYIFGLYRTCKENCLLGKPPPLSEQTCAEQAILESPLSLAPWWDTEVECASGLQTFQSPQLLHSSLFLHTT